MARRGRPPKGEYPEKKPVFASRIREDTWEMLQRAAAKSGRSLSQEFGFKLGEASMMMKKLKARSETSKHLG